MFERQQRKPFPFVYFIAAAVVLGVFYYAWKSSNARPQSLSPEQQSFQNANGKTNGLLPAEWFFLEREYPDFKLEVETYMQRMKEIAAKEAVAERNGLPGFENSWRVEGPGNIGARINAIAVQPTNPNVIYVGYSAGGVWKTTNGGTTWIPIFDQGQASAIGDIVIDPSNPNRVYVATGDANIGGYSYSGDGLWKSENGGNTWTNIGLAEQRILSKIVIDPSNPNTIYVGAMGNPSTADENRGLYKTTNGGTTWTKVLNITDKAGIIDLVMHHTSPNTLYAASWDRQRTNNLSYVAGDNAKIWKSTNGGSTWTNLTNGLPQEKKGRIGLAIDTQNPNRLMAVIVDSSSQLHSIRETTNGGTSWNELSTNGLDASILGGFGWYFGKMYINPFNPSDIWVLGVDLWRSQDGGDNWALAAPEWWTYDVHADKHEMVFLSGTSFLLATDGGLYKTTDNAAFWEKIENIPTTQLYRVAYNPHDPTTYYGGAQDNGTMSGDASTINAWERIYGGDGFQAAFHPTDETKLYVETQNGNINYYDDNEGFWQDGNAGMNDGDKKNWDMPYFISPNDPEKMFAGTDKVYRSIGHPAFWEPVSEDLTDGNIYGSRYHTITEVSESPLVADKVYVGTSDANVWRGTSTNGSWTWTNINAGLPERYVSGVVASPNQGNTVFVTYTGYKYNDYTPLVYSSTNNGNTWTSIAGDLPPIAINCLLSLPGHQDMVLFVGTDAGVYGTVDGGAHWERLGTDMPMVPVYDLKLNVAEDRLIAGTFGRSIMSYPLQEISTNSNQPTFTENQWKVFPTVTNDIVNIQLQPMVGAASNCNLQVFDMNGKLVHQSTLSSRQEMTSIYVNGWPAGAYLVNLSEQGKSKAQKKFVVY